MLDKIGDGRSPIKGGKWKRKLSPEYKKLKSEESGITFSNLELEGEMLDELEVNPHARGIEIKIEGDQAGKADGNNRGTYGSKTPNAANMREFIPKTNQKLKKDIMDGVKRIIKRVAESDED